MKLHFMMMIMTTMTMIKVVFVPKHNTIKSYMGHVGTAQVIHPRPWHLMDVSS
jgi:hypothetical protein